jgi:hypothetical protein
MTASLELATASDRVRAFNEVVPEGGDHEDWFFARKDTATLSSSSFCVRCLWRS